MRLPERACWQESSLLHIGPLGRCSSRFISPCPHSSDDMKGHAAGVTYPGAILGPVARSRRPRAMDPIVNKAELLQSLLSQAQQLPHRDDDALQALQIRNEMLIRRIFGHKSFYLGHANMPFRPNWFPSIEEEKNASWGSGKQAMINLIQTMVEDIREFESALTPVLTIKDIELRRRTSDLLSAPGQYDRVLRESTTILEDRIRGKVPFEDLAKIFPNAADQTGDSLINKLFSPNKPVVVYGDRQEQTQLSRMLGGVLAYLRNPSHHSIDNDVEWSWAWSVVGLVDQLLDDIASSRYHRPSDL